MKPFEFDELNARLRALTRRYDGISSSYQVGGWRFYAEDRIIESPYSGRVLLTETETELLTVLASEPTRTFSREQLLARAFTLGERIATVSQTMSFPPPVLVAWFVAQRATKPDGL